MKKEFEEQQKQGGILPGGMSASNPMGNFDMAAWMADKTSGSAGATTGRASGNEDAGGSAGGSGSGKARRRG